MPWMQEKFHSSWLECAYTSKAAWKQPEDTIRLVTKFDQTKMDWESHEGLKFR